MCTEEVVSQGTVAKLLETGSHLHVCTPDSVVAMRGWKASDSVGCKRTLSDRTRVIALSCCAIRHRITHTRYLAVII